MQKLPEPYRGSPIETRRWSCPGCGAPKPEHCTCRYGQVHVVHHGPEPSRPLMGFAGWLVAIGVLAPFSPDLAFVFALTSFALLIVANQVGWSWVKRS